MTLPNFMVIGLQIWKLHRGAEFAPPLAVQDSKKPGLFRVKVIQALIELHQSILMVALLCGTLLWYHVWYIMYTLTGAVMIGEEMNKFQS